MTGASKILTVSYGTFSCTLEGFDDPFNTMKAIAEYFRDLAAEDRYFGAEPPTPDAAMLHRIAEREIQRRVEAKVQENGVVLRASDGAAAPAVMAEPAPAPKAEAPRLIEAAPQGTETVAEKLSRLRAEVAGQSAAATVPTASLAVPAQDYSVPEFVSPDFGEEDDYDLPASPATDFADLPLAEEAPRTAPLTAAELADLLPEDAADPAAEVPEDMAPAAPAEMPAAAAVVAEDPAPATAMQDTDALLAGLMANLATPPAALPEPQIAETERTAQDDAAAAEFAEVSLPELAQDAAEDIRPEAEVEAGVDADPSIFTDAAPADAGAEEGEAISLFAPEADDDAPAPAPDTADGSDTADLTGPTVAAATSDAQTDQPDASAAAVDLRPDATEKLLRARARVVRIRRGEEVDTDASADRPAMPAPIRPAPAPVLSPEEEAELAAELAALSAEPEAAEPAAPVLAEEPAPAAVAARDEDDDTGEDADDRSVAAAPDLPAAEGTPAAADVRRVFDAATADDTISRLMAQADEHLEGPESKRRLSAIAHLKAAVAATVAERRATGDKPKDAEPSQLSRYRDDLAKVVRSKLGAATSGERPAPLVLVSEQRIDRPRPVAVPQPAPETLSVVPPAPQPAPQPAAPVVPRRLAGAAGLAFAQDEEEMEAFAEAVADSGDFLDFAERLGAKTLGELIEASAAYLACVEGREQFTRPQLMGLVQAALPGGDIPREDGLRSFGTLLRTGRIEKIRRGQFALSDRSAYLAEGRRIAG